MPDAPIPPKRIAKFYTPLALSWVFMAIESPICVGLISRMPDPIVNTAAFPVLMGLAIWIESPVIDLLSTSTTLSRNRHNYALIRRFALALMAGVTLVHALVTLTPVYDLLTRTVMRIPDDVADAVRLGMAIMIPWSAAIGWRRYLQGILIRFDRTRLIGIGTAVRVGTLTVVGLSLFALTGWPSIAVAATALVCSVTAESLFIHLVSRDVIARKFLGSQSAPEDSRIAAAPIVDVEPEPASAALQPLTSDPAPHALSHDARPLALRALVAFHAPLTLTTMVTLIGNPIVSAFLAATPENKLALAAWGVASTLMWLMRTITYALPEVVIALHTGPASARSLKRYCIGVGLGTCAAMLLFGLLGVDLYFFKNVLHAKPEVLGMAHMAFLAGSALPLLSATQSYVRGMLTAHHLTASRLLAILVGIISLALGFAAGLQTGWPGVAVASLALTFALSVELLVLVWSWKVGKRSMRHALSPV